MLAAVLVVAVAPWSTAVPDATKKEIARLEEGLKRSETGRRLMAETLDVERRAAELPGDAVAYREEPRPHLAFDLAGLERTKELEFQLLLARELARAALRLPLRLLETELAARQRELEVALDLCAADPELSRRLRSLSKSEPEGTAPPPGRTEQGRVARGLALVARDPQAFYDWVERGLPEDENRVALWEAVDFDARHPGDDGKTGRIRRRIVSAFASSMRKSGGFSRAKEALSGLETREADLLSRRARKWLNSSR